MSETFSGQLCPNPSFLHRDADIFIHFYMLAYAPYNALCLTRRVDMLLPLYPSLEQKSAPEHRADGAKLRKLGLTAIWVCRNE